MAYARPWKSLDEQLTLLQSRGMATGNREQAISYLERIGYYRLSAYWYPFRVFQLHQDPNNGRLSATTTDQFHPDTHFLDAVNLYLFDKQLRLLVMDALERVEVAIRVDIAHLLGERSTFAHADQTQFHPGFSGKQFRGKTAFQHWQDKYSGLLHRSKEDFVRHYRKKYGDDLPIWVAIELWDFGAMSQLFAMMNVADQSRIAAKYGIQDFRVFSSWLRALNYLRNVTAHHSRLWNRNIIDQPKLPVAGQIGWCNHFIGKADLVAKPFLLLAILRHLAKTICPNTEWHQRVKDHLLSFPEAHSAPKRGLNDIGTPTTWQEWW